MSKVILRNRFTGQYYAGSAGWSEDGSRAHDFGVVDGAARFALTQSFANLEVVLCDDDPTRDLVMPIPEKGWSLPDFGCLSGVWPPLSGAPDLT